GDAVRRRSPAARNRLARGGGASQQRRVLGADRVGSACRAGVAPEASQPAPSVMTTSISPASRDAPPRRRSSASTVVVAIVAIGAVVAGIFVGRGIALEQSRGLFLAGAVPMFLLAIVVVGLCLVGLVSLGVRRGRLNVAIGTVFATAGLLAGGSVAGWASAAATSGTEPVPVVLR